jgi:hypothetical protein
VHEASALYFFGYFFLKQLEVDRREAVSSQRHDNAQRTGFINRGKGIAVPIHPKDLRMRPTPTAAKSEQLARADL